MSPEKKIDEIVSVGNLLIQGFITPCRSDRNLNGRGVLFYIRDDIPSNLSAIDKPPAEGRF